MKKSELRQIIKEELKTLKEFQSVDEPQYLLNQLKNQLKNADPKKKREIQQAIQHLESLLIYM